MFGEKIYPQQKKAKRQHGAAFYIIGIFTFAIECMLGINAAFLVDQSLHIVVFNMLAGTGFEVLAAFITLIVSLAVGFCFMAGGMWTFTGFMDSLKDARAYSKHYKLDKWAWPVWIIWGLAVAVIALDFTTLLFRASFFAAKGGEALFWFFVILIPMPFLLGLIVYVLENTPRDRRLAKARQYAEQLESDSVTGVVEMMDEDLRSRWLSDDSTALQEHYNRVNKQRQDAYEYEQQRMAERDAQKRQTKEAQADQPLLTIPMPKMFSPKLQAVPNQQQAQQDGNQKRA